MCPVCQTPAQAHKSPRRAATGTHPNNGPSTHARTVSPSAAGPQPSVTGANFSQQLVTIMSAKMATKETDGIAGIVRQVTGPFTEEARPDPWRRATLLIVHVGLLPGWFLLQLFRISWHFAVVVLTQKGSAFPNNPSSQSNNQFLKDHDPAHARPIYHYVIENGVGESVSARQEGEFVDGRILQGHRVQLDGNWRGGTLVISSGENETLNCRLSYPINPWKVGFCLALMGFCVEIGILFALGQSSRYAP